MEPIQILDLGNGWYDFKNIPQGYIKIHGLNCGDKLAALKRAAKINPGYYYEIVKAEQVAA